MSTGRPKKAVALLRSGNRLVVDPTTPKVRDLITPHLRYTEKVFTHGVEQVRRRKAGLPLFDEVEWECYADDHKGRLATSYGFHDRLVALLEGAGYSVESRWASKVEKARREEMAATVYSPQWDRIEAVLKSGFKYRYKQKTALKLIAGYDCGRIDCPPGWGKGTVIRLACELFPEARIDVVTKNIPVLQTRLYPELAANLPSVGIIGGGQKIKGRRVMCVSADSLHHGRPDADFVFVDEGHQACSDVFAGKMGVYEHARVWMFSASWDMRLDNKDLRAEAMAGPIRLRVTYKEAEERGIVVPIEVFWTRVVMDVNPCAGMSGPTKEKYGIWANEYRNKLVARDAREFDSDTQVLITVKTLEHALHLKRLLPEYRVVYSGLSLTDKEVAWFRKTFPDEFRRMSDARKRKLTARFEAGKLKKVIATPVWNVGVDFRHLEVLIRADAGGSPVNDTQIPGRNSRTNDALAKAAGPKKKRVGIVRDYTDQFDAGFRQKAQGREKSYAKNEWNQHFPKDGSMLRKMMHFGSVT